MVVFTFMLHEYKLNMDIDMGKDTDTDMVIEP